MNSLTLKEDGFTDFVPLKGLPFSSLPYNKSSVIVIADSTLTGKPASDIVYIGKTKKPTKEYSEATSAATAGKPLEKYMRLYSMMDS